MAGSIRGVGIAAVLLCLFALQQAPFIMLGRYSRRVVWEGTSPDEQFRLEIRTQATFPAYDILDPSGAAYFTVTESRTRDVAAETEVPLREIFDFQRPKVTWTPEYVEVVDFDEYQPAAVVRLPLAR